MRHLYALSLWKSDPRILKSTLKLGRWDSDNKMS